MMLRNKYFSISTTLLFALAMVSMVGCVNQSNEAVKPDTFAPTPPSDSADGEKKGSAKPTESAQG